jgi:hypothetical protein
MIAADFGNVRHIYPVGEFEICWSQRVGDLYMETLTRDVPGFDSFLENAAYLEGDLRGALSSGNEIMLRCTMFYSLAEPLDDLCKVMPGCGGS